MMNEYTEGFRCAITTKKGFIDYDSMDMIKWICYS